MKCWWHAYHATRRRFSFNISLLRTTYLLDYFDDIIYRKHFTDNMTVFDIYRAGIAAKPLLTLHTQAAAGLRHVYRRRSLPSSVSFHTRLPLYRAISKKHPQFDRRIIAKFPCFVKILIRAISVNFRYYRLMPSSLRCKLFHICWIWCFWHTSI